MDISFIIPSFNGAHKLLKSLPSVFKNILNTNCKIIIVVDGSTDNSIEILKNFKNDSLHFINQSNQGRSLARNNGINYSESEYLFLLDDDIRIAENCLKIHQEHHLKFPNSILIGKVNLEKSEFDKDFQYYLQSSYEKWDENFQTRTLITIDNFKFTACHLSLSKMTMDKLGGFDHRLHDAEDYDLGMRAIDLNIPIYFDPDAISWHNDRLTCKQYIKRQIEYKRSHKLLENLQKKYKKDVFIPIKKPKNIFKLMLLHFLKNDFWVKLIDDNMLKMSSKKFKFKFYATVIYAHTLKGMGII
ncbi:MAG: glycosyltransferase family 2 protein [Opitutaceae bacterium]|nr:glycosyltransferase family 2 protein [Cytophagales bacterium]